MQMQWTEINGAVMRHCRTGAGPTLVLVHEMGGSLHSYDALTGLLADSYTVIRYDLRGAGMSEKVSGELDVGPLRDDLLSLIDLEGASPALVLGTAVGAGIALLAAATAPDRIRAVIGLSPVTECLPENRQALLAHAARIENEGLRSMAPTSMPMILPEPLRRDAAAFEGARGRWLANDPRGFAAIYRMLANMDLRPRLADVECPCLLVGALYDGLRTPAQVKDVALALSGARYLEIESGHLPAVQTPELVASLVRDFSRELQS